MKIKDILKKKKLLIVFNVLNRLIYLKIKKYFLVFDFRGYSEILEEIYWVWEFRMERLLV